MPAVARPLLPVPTSKTLPAVKMTPDTLNRKLVLMPMNSVNTNVGALVALQNLNATSSELMTVQARINTGKRVASAKDNGAIWAMASLKPSTRSRNPCNAANRPSMWRSRPVKRSPTCSCK